ncbi:unannotated protein [freshwater metagenome]|uniref:Unannotated protein n=1 Tax=freshwater metagenome TaxID=449393 RepID=A0A6J7KPP2_9ZZZZ|nr:ABC transporter permease [Actinomycetota bacterium]
MATSVSVPASRSAHVWRLLGRYGAIIVLVAMCGVFAALQPTTFLTVDNFVNIISQSAIIAIIAIGLTFPLVGGDFDLSIGYVATLGGVLVAMLMANYGMPYLLAIVLVIVVGGVVGVVNGVLVTRVGINALVATLGMGTIVLGIVYALTGGVPVQLNNEAFTAITFNRLLGLPWPVWVMAAVALLAWFLLNRTVAGHGLQATGGNPVAAALSGLRVGRLRTGAFVMAGAASALAGVLITSRSGSATAEAGTPLLLGAFTACFLGAAVLTHGKFHIVGTLIGVLTVAVGFNGIVLIGLGSYLQYLLQGTLLIFAVGVGTLSSRMSSAS